MEGMTSGQDFLSGQVYLQITVVGPSFVDPVFFQLSRSFDRQEEEERERAKEKVSFSLFVDNLSIKDK